MNVQRVFSVITCTLGVLLLSLSAARAQQTVPQTLTQQGRLFDNAGGPVNGQVPIEFTLYDTPTVGTAIWTEVHTVTLEDGYFVVQLGSQTPFPEEAFYDASASSGRYFGIRVGTDDEMTPRQAVTSVPYALRASFADFATEAEAASRAPFAGLTGVPAPCEAPNFLRGYNASKQPVCVAPPAPPTPTLTCTTRSAATTTTFFVGVTCQSGEIMTGGGCSTSDFPMYSSSPNGTGTGWFCTSDTTDTITAYARCCRVQ
jgi:hypothetical protein